MSASSSESGGADGTRDRSVQGLGSWGKLCGPMRDAGIRGAVNARGWFVSMAMGTGNRGGLRANFGSDDVVSMGSGGGGNDSRVVGAVRR